MASKRSKKKPPARVRKDEPTTSRVAPERSVPVLDAGSETPRERLFPIVGIGASAGGLEALEQFLKKVPEHSGMAFVIVQHLDPTSKGAMVELLQRVTPMRVRAVADRQTVEPDCVYVIPPNHDMSILHGVLHLLPQGTTRGVHLPIDHFFRSLAADREHAAIAVVLSGMGTDGTLGLRAIKEKAGATFVQSLASAKFDGMPRSAVEAGLADVVAPAEELPERILEYVRHAPHLAGTARHVVEEQQQSALEKVCIQLRAVTGNDFSLYKRSTVQRRIERRMGLHQIDSLASYVRYLRENPRETELLFHELLIGVTSFFRDPEAWEALRTQVVRELVSARAKGGVIRAWVPACSTGEEAYSMAMLLAEAVDAAHASRSLSFQILATDLDKDAIDHARQGLYPSNIAADVSPERLRRFFVQESNGYRVRKELRDSVVFALQNVITDPPFTKLDILSCRNFLIYLSAELQKKLIPLFHYSLNPNGVLFLGSAETIGQFTGLFSPIDAKSRLYRRLATPIGMPIVEFPSAFVARDSGALDRDEVDQAKTPAFNLQTLADRIIVQRFSPAAVLTSDEGDILYISGRTGKFLEPPVGKAHMNIFTMARAGLRFELSRAYASALKGERPVTVRGVKVKTNGSTAAVDVTVQRITDPRELRGTVMVVLAESSSPPTASAPHARPMPSNKRIAELEKELERARDEVQATREEMQTSQEELKSANEELQSTNEELQSTNEELTTSKEEMQSMNEELQTVNQELQSKLDDLARTNNDMRNLLNSIDVATLFLDSELHVRRFTRQTTKIIKLIPSDAGRPITDIATQLDYPDLADDAREVLRTLAFKEKQVAARDGRWFTVRIMAYRTVENVIDGLVITFTDSTSAKVMEATLREQASQLRQMTESLPTLVWGARPDGAWDYVSPQWIAYTGAPVEEQLGYGWLSQVHDAERDRVREEWRSAVAAGTRFDSEFRICSRDGAFRWFKTRSVPIHDEKGKIVKWYATSTDVDDLKRGAVTRMQEAEAMRRLLAWIEEPAFVVDAQLAVRRCNAAAASLLGCSSEAIIGKSLIEALPRAAGGAFESSLRDAVRSALRTQSAVETTLRIEDGSGATTFDALAQPAGDVVSVLLRPA